MVRTLVFLVVLSLVVIPAARAAVAEEAPAAAADVTGSDETKKVDKYLGIDWGDDKTKTSDQDDPEAKKPSKEVDLEQALSSVQLKRLKKIKAGAGKAATMTQKGDKAYNGEDKKLKKIDSVKLYDAAGKLYRKPILDMERLAKQVKVTDEDAQLTLLRQFRDTYRDQACEMFCKAAGVVIEEAKGLGDLKKAVLFLKSARQVNPKYPGINEVRSAARARAKEIMTQLAEAAQQRTTGGGEKEDDDRYVDPRGDRDYKDTGRTDYKEIGR